MLTVFVHDLRFGLGIRQVCILHCPLHWGSDHRYEVYSMDAGPESDPAPEPLCVSATNNDKARHPGLKTKWYVILFSFFFRSCLIDILDILVIRFFGTIFFKHLFGMEGALQTGGDRDCPKETAWI